MRKLSLVLVVGLLLAGTVAACGGGGSKTVKVGDTNVKVGGGVPSDFPKDFPVYTGADVQGSATGTEGGVTGTVVTWQTGDGVDKVKDFYDKAFKDGPWKSNSTGTAGDGSFWVVDSPDGKKAAYVGATKSGDKTMIIVTIGDKDQTTGGGEDASPTSSSSSSKKTATPSSDETSGGGSSSSPEAAQLPDEVKLGKDFPTDRVPFPSGARVTNTSSFTSAGATTSFVELYVKDKADKVADYFTNEMPKHNWTSSFASTSNGQYFISFAGGDNEALTITVEDSDTPGYAKVSISVVTSG